MRIIQLPKGNGKFRTIYVPTHEEKRELRSINGKLQRAVRSACGDTVHGFVRGKSAVTNAQQHVGHAYTLSFDLRDFFDTVTPAMVKDRVPKEFMDKVFVDGAPRQGLPSSPAVANLAAVPLDKAILKWGEKHGKQFIYTRYADDLTFSFDDPEVGKALLPAVKGIVRQCGFFLAEHKTHLQNAAGGRRMVTGVAVGDTDIRAPREVRRRLRAALHQGKTDHARGLAEWCALKPPRPRASVGRSGDDLEKLHKAWKLSGKVLKALDKPSEDLGEGCWILGDVVSMLGMSTFTTGWRSCMAFPNGAYRKGVVSWVLQPHTRVAALLSDKTCSEGGVERPAMIARVLVHECTKGFKVWGRPYPSEEAAAPLLDKLRALGYIDIKAAPTGIRVKGTTPWVGSGPYLDTGTFRAKKFGKLVTLWR